MNKPYIKKRMYDRDKFYFIHCPLRSKAIRKQYWFFIFFGKKWVAWCDKPLQRKERKNHNKYAEPCH